MIKTEDCHAEVLEACGQRPLQMLSKRTGHYAHASSASAWHPMKDGKINTTKKVTGLTEGTEKVVQ